MKKHNRINWVRGLEITSELFIETDNYNDYQQSVVRKLCSLRSFGIIPGDNSYYVDYLMENGILTIKNLNCFALTQGAHLIDTANNLLVLPHEIRLNENPSGMYYVLLSIKSQKYISGNKNEHIQKLYALELCDTDTIVPENAFPVMKINCPENSDHWEVDTDYIVPSMVLGASEKLYQRLNSIKNRLNQLILKIEDRTLLNQILIYELELSAYTFSETPSELILLLKKILKTFSLFMEKSLQYCERFVYEPYNHFEVSELLDMCTMGLNEIDIHLEKKPEPIPEPEPEEPKEFLDEI